MHESLAGRNNRPDLALHVEQVPALSRDELALSIRVHLTAEQLLYIG